MRDEDTLKEIKRQLQAMAVDDPEEGKDLHPCIVLDREGMKTGLDSDNPFLPDSEKKIASPAELYSSYYIEHPAPPGEKIRWPDLLIFFRGHYQGTVPGDAGRDPQSERAGDQDDAQRPGDAGLEYQRHDFRSPATDRVSERQRGAVAGYGDPDGHAPRGRQCEKAARLCNRATR